MSERVAIVAVHGVAYHEPGASANAMSELLLGLPEERGAKYGPFAAETVHIPLHPLSVEPLVQPPEGGLFNRFLDRFRERTVYLTRGWRSAGGKRQLVGEKPDEMAANDFMRLVLQEYRGSKDNKPKDERDATAYRTARLAGKRTWKDDSGADQAIGVDVYEMYWADLSRPKQTLLSFFQALYQLLFHLASLSRLAISTSFENRDDWRWRALDWTQGWAVRMLTLPIPILNVLLLISLLGALPHMITSDSTARIAAICGAAFLGLLIYAVLSRKLPATGWPWTWVLFPLVFMLSLAAIAGFLISFTHTSPQAVLAFEVLLLGSDVYRRLSAGSYDDVRDGTWETALCLWIPWMILFIVLLFWHPAIPVEQITLWVVQIVIAALRLSWILLFGFAFAAFVLGELSWRKIRRDEKKEKRGNQNRCARARAAVRTSRFALAMPTLGILIVTVSLWSGLFVKAAGSNGQYGNSIAVRLFGNSIQNLWSGPSCLPSFLLRSVFLDRKTVKPYLEESPASFTINTSVVSAPTSVNISATYKGDSQIATLKVKPAAFSLDPTTVTGGTPSTGTITLNSPVPESGAVVALSSSNPEVAAVPGNVTVIQGSPAPTLATATPPSGAVGQGSTTAVASLRPNDYFQGLLVWSVTPGLPLALLLMVSGLFLLVLWALPSISTEKVPPVRSKNSPSRRMGEWLSRGLDSTKIVAGLAWCAAFVVPLVFAFYYTKSWIHATVIILLWIGGVAGSVAILASFAKSGSSILGIVLDVDNYLRTSPKDETPRARIIERYVSLLHYLSEYKSPDGAGYDRVVIVAHSLGALISADLLRFLKVQSDSPKIPLVLFTMGNPLRQLLNRFFPYLYEWVHPVPDNSLSPLNDVPQTVPPVIDPGKSLGPNPNQLGVAHWVNAYRSGDYVGRSLWLDEWYDREVPPREHPDKPGPVYIAAEIPPGPREEMCIGAGAHQHYWDQSAPDIAEKLDDLIWP